MARQATNPVSYTQTVRTDTGTTLTSGRAGKVVPVKFIPLLRGDSASGRIGVDIELAEMPRPLQNAAIANVQAWFVPKSAHPQFSGSIDLMHAWQGEGIKTLDYAGEVVRNAPPYFFVLTSAAQKALVEASELFRHAGIHPVKSGDNVEDMNTDYIDAFNLIYNFRLAAHSSRLERRPYAVEDLDAATTLPRAFWPKGRFSKVVPDYERALIVGELGLDVAQGQLSVTARGDFAGFNNLSTHMRADTSLGVGGVQNTNETHDIIAEMAGERVNVTLAEIDKARVTQAFAKLRSTYAGNDSTGFDNDDAIVATLMQGFSVPAEDFKRPWLLDSATVSFAMQERFASDGNNLEKSVTQGRVQATLSLNVPVANDGGVIVVTVEVLPERLDERQSDEYLHVTAPGDLPDALRDSQRVEPVDEVLNRRLDARHVDPSAIYGFEPMNYKWDRASTMLGGVYYQANPANPFREQRAAIWQTSIRNPTFTEDHWLCPDNFPHDVFSDTLAPAFELAAGHTLAIRGLTQMGDMLVENNDDYDNVIEAEEI